MKKTLLLLFLLPHFLQAQPTVIPDTAFTNGNNIKALVNANGALFYDFEKGQFLPDDSGRSPIRAAGVWLGGTDAVGNLKVSAQRYNENGKQDFAPGMANLSEEENLHWNKIWRAKAEDVLYHQKYFQIHGAVKDTIPSIFAWPGTGNKYFKQFNGFDLPDNDMELAHLMMKTTTEFMNQKKENTQYLIGNLVAGHFLPMRYYGILSMII